MHVVVVRSVDEVVLQSDQIDKVEEANEVMDEKVLEDYGVGKVDELEYEVILRPLSAPFLFRTSGKGTDMALWGPEKYGRIDFSLGRWTTMGQNAPKLELKHAKEQVELVRIFLRSLLRPQESLF